MKGDEGSKWKGEAAHGIQLLVVPADPTGRKRDAALAVPSRARTHERARHERKRRFPWTARSARDLRRRSMRWQSERKEVHCV